MKTKTFKGLFALFLLLFSLVPLASAEDSAMINLHWLVSNDALTVDEMTIDNPQEVEFLLRIDGNEPFPHLDLQYNDQLLSDYTFEPSDFGISTVKWYKFKFTPEQNGKYEIIARAINNGAGQAADTLTLTVGSANEAPIAAFTWSPKQPLPRPGDEVSFRDLSYDADGDILVANWNFDDGYLVSLNSNPVHVYEESGEYDVKLVVSDGQATDMRIHTVKVRENNEPTYHYEPEADSNTLFIFPTFERAEGEDFVIAIVGEDIDNDDLTFSYEGDLPQGVTFNDQARDNLATISGTTQETGVFGLSITVEDNYGGEFTWPVFLDIAEVEHPNNAPTLTFDPRPRVIVPNNGNNYASYLVTPGEEFTLTALGEDVDGDSLTLSSDVSEDWVNLVDNGDDTITLTALAPEGADSAWFSVTVTDEHGAEVTKYVLFNVRDIPNNTPTLTFDPRPRVITPNNGHNYANYLVTPGEEFTLTALGEDVDGDSLTLSSDVTEDWVDLVDNGDDTITLTALAPEGADSAWFSVSVTDEHGAEVTKYVVFNVRDTPNNAPRITFNPEPDIYITAQGVAYPWYGLVANEPFIITAIGYDEDNDDLTFAGTTAADWIDFVDNGDGTATISGMPNEAITDPVGLIVVVQDEHGAEQTSQLLFTVEEAPVINTPPQVDFSWNPEEPLAGEEVQFNSLTFDVDGDVLGYAWDLDSDGQRDAYHRNPTFTYSTPGTYDVTLTVSDGHEGVTVTKQITVRELPPVNHAPEVDFIWTPASPLVNENVIFTSIATDIDGDVLSYAWDFNNDGIVDSTEEVANYDAFTVAGIHDITLTVSDGEETATLTKQIVVRELPPVNNLPDIDPIGNKEITEDNELSFTVTGNDADNDVLTYEVEYYARLSLWDRVVGWFFGEDENHEWTTNLPAETDFNTQSGEFEYAPEFDAVEHPELVGYHYYRFNTYDGQSHSEWEIVEIKVIDNNRIPVIDVTEQAVTVIVDEETSFGASAHDDDGDDLTYTWTVDGTTLIDRGVSYTFTETGDYTVSLSVTDNFGGMDNHELLVVVTEAPVVDVLGCMDIIAENYNVDATVDDGSCSYPVADILGCMDITAENYNVDATVDDGSCSYPVADVLGCMDITAENYNVDATLDDGSCSYPVADILGCMDITADNYNVDATLDDGSCSYPVEEPEDILEKDLYFQSIHLNQEEVYAGEDLVLVMDVVNGGEVDMEDLTITATIYEWGVKQSTSRFDLDESEDITKAINLRTPYFAEPGYYLVKLTVSNDQYHESAYREVLIN